MGMVDTSLMSPDLVFMGLEAASPDELFVPLERTLVGRGFVRATWREAITRREGAYPTGLAFESVGVAIPHVEPEHIVAPYIAIVRPCAPVRFGGMGGMPPVDAELVVNLGLLAHVEEQVPTIQALMDVFSDTEAVSDLLGQTTPEGMAASMRRWCGELAR